MIGPWEVTASGHGPVMYCAGDDSLSDSAVLAQIKALLKRAKKDSVSITAITVSVDDDGSIVTLMGTEGGVYR